MKKYAILCGSAPNDYRQKKLEEKYDFLETKEGFEPGSIVSFPNGVTELFLESVLNESFDKAADEDSDSSRACQEKCVNGYISCQQIGTRLSNSMAN